MKNFYTYTKFEYRCHKCGWLGFGEEMERGDSYDNGFEIECPKCGERLDFVSLPTRQETLDYGSEAEKEEVRKQMDMEGQS